MVIEVCSCGGIIQGDKIGQFLKAIWLKIFIQ